MPPTTPTGSRSVSSKTARPLEWFHHTSCAPRRRNAAPGLALETGARGGHCAVHVAGLAVGHGGQQFAGRGVDDIDSPAVLRVFAAAVDEQLAWVEELFDFLSCGHDLFSRNREARWREGFRLSARRH